MEGGGREVGGGERKRVFFDHLCMEQKLLFRWISSDSPNQGFAEARSTVRLEYKLGCCLACHNNNNNMEVLQG